MKTCVQCQTEHPLDNFERAAQNKDGLVGKCRPCMRAYRSQWQKTNRHRIRLQTYGLTPPQYEQLWNEQGGLCAICKTVEPTNIDHCHQTGLVRGLLCGLCNRMLGQAQDNPDRLLAGVAYLSKPPRS